MRGSQLFGLILEPDFDFIPWKLTDTRPRDRCSRTQLVLLPSDNFFSVVRGFSTDQSSGVTQREILDLYIFLL